MKRLKFTVQGYVIFIPSMGNLLKQKFPYKSDFSFLGKLLELPRCIYPLEVFSLQVFSEQTTATFSSSIQQTMVYVAHLILVY